MKLLIEEIMSAGAGGKLTPTTNYNVEAIRPHLYKHNNPTGSLTVTISDSAGNLIATSDPVVITDISAAAFFHGHVRFYIKASLEANVEYLIKVIGSDGYTFSESAYAGLCRDFDFHTYPATYTVTGALAAPFDIEVWARSAR